MGQGSEVHLGGGGEADEYNKSILYDILTQVIKILFLKGRKIEGN